MPEDNNDLMAQRIKELRMKNNLSQEQLAEMLGLQKSAIAKYENGRVVNIKRSTIANMAEIFHCSPSYIMGWETPRPNKNGQLSLLDELEKKIVYKRETEIIEKFRNITYEEQCDILYISKLYLLLDECNRSYVKQTLEHLIKLTKSDIQTPEKNITQKENKQNSSDLRKMFTEIMTQAAHANDNATPEENKHDDDIMDNDDEWK